MLKYNKLTLGPTVNKIMPITHSAAIIALSFSVTLNDHGAFYILMNASLFVSDAESDVKTAFRRVIIAVQHKLLSPISTKLSNLIA